MGDAGRKSRFGDFQRISVNYARGRKAFPIPVFRYILKQIQTEHPSVLDIGCGTGIASRQLHDAGAHVVGADISIAMIRQAQSDNPHDLAYVVAASQKLPFKEHSFDAVTAFSAFHWFTDRKSLAELRRVLKKDGIFFAVNKNESGNFKQDYFPIVSSCFNGPLPDGKRGYAPVDILRRNGFTDISEKSFECSEYFTVDEALLYVQSTAIWEVIPGNKQNSCLYALRKHFEFKLRTQSSLHRDLTVTVISARAGANASRRTWINN